MSSYTSPGSNPGVTRRNVLLGGAALIAANALGVDPAEAAPRYYFVATGSWDFNTARFKDGSRSPYRYDGPGTVRTGQRGTPDNLRFAVANYQRLLNDRYRIPTEVDGVFGPGTAKSVSRFQKSRGMRASGVIGPTTSYKMLFPVIQEASRRHRARPRLVTAVAKLEGGYNIGAVNDNDVGPNGPLDSFDLGPAQLSVRWNKKAFTIPQMFEPERVYGEIAKRMARGMERYKGRPDEELLSALSWNTPAGADRIWRGGQPNAKETRYMAYISDTIASSFGREAGVSF